VQVPASIEHAEQTLIELALASEDTANSLSHELPPEKLTNTVMGKALNELINCTLNGEWEHAREHLSDLERENPSAALSKLLLEQNSYSEKQTKKALDDCLKTINSYFSKQKLTELMNKLRTATPDEKIALMKELQGLTSGS
jgi:hypothetical protein